MPRSNPSPAVRTRLQEIEEIASTARRETIELIAHYHKSLERAQSPEDLAIVAGYVAGGEAKARPNLYRGRERVAGLLVEYHQEADILYEAYDPAVRQRFTIAHELGHLYLHAFGGHTQAVCLPSRVDPEDQPGDGSAALDPEDEADAFAGAFLMPANELQSDIAHFGLSVAFLAERYGVSERAMSRRLQTLEILHDEDRAPV